MYHGLAVSYRNFFEIASTCHMEYLYPYLRFLGENTELVCVGKTAKLLMLYMRSPTLYG